MLADGWADGLAVLLGQKMVAMWAVAKVSQLAEIEVAERDD